MKTKSHYIIALIAFVLWGLTFPFGKMVLPPLSSYSFVFLRSLMGFSLLFVILAIQKEIKPWFQSLKENFWSLFLFSLGPFALSYTIQFYAIQYTTAINQSIIAQTSVIWVVLINFLVFKQKPQLKFIMGVLTGIFGVILIITSSSVSSSTNTLKGDLLSIVAFICWGSYTAFSKPLAVKIKPKYLTTSVLMFGGIFLSGISIGTGLFDQVNQLTTIQWVVLLYLGFICTGLAYLLHMIGLSGPEVKSEYIAYFTLIMPIISASFSVLFLGEQLSWRIGLGTFFVFLSVLIIQYKRRKLLPQDDISSEIQP